MADHERSRAGGDGYERCTDRAGTAMKRHHAGRDRDKKRQGVHREREGQPAE
ncbi:hypothetical protein [Bradyrhizobium sp. Tv2a-2]|uniref:hypothetical protein n=1 Tax=Bradyrhizobium sp. Tv2a-2 TaxID=113395 RepID=UPI0012EC61AB|nr:hypothetical protein [Bradyrhizobium sp. Tv2a-2]